MSSRTVLSTSCNAYVASATGIFKAGSVRSDPADHFRAPPSFSTLNRFAPSNYAFGVKKPRRKQIRQRPYSSRARGMVPACPARCLK
jgi:hypothetical protein